MRRLAALTLSTALLLALPGCESLEEIFGTDDEAGGLTAEALTGKILNFENPFPDTDIGEHRYWEYTFRDGSALGCNSEAQYTATSWTLIDDQTIRVYFGSQYEQYQLLTMEGNLADGTFKGTFYLTSSVPGNVVENGKFRQTQTNTYC